MSIGTFFHRFYTLGKGVSRGIAEQAQHDDPIDLFAKWFEDAKRAGLPLPEAVAVASSTPEGKASLRMVLLKGFDQQGFVFFSNYHSRKAHEIEQNPQVALLFHWNALQRQVRIEGTISRTERAESDAYFRSRPRNSRIGAWASKQSATLAERAQLEARVAQCKERFKDKDIPLPDFWGGYRVIPETIEFWQGRADRLHDRLLFEKQAQGWSSSRLYP